MPQPARTRRDNPCPTTAAWAAKRSDQRSGRASTDIVLDVLAGAVAGAAAVWVMDRVDWFNYWRGLDSRRTRQQTRQVRPRGSAPMTIAR